MYARPEDIAARPDPTVVRFNVKLGMVYAWEGPEGVAIRLPYRDDLVGSPDSGAVASGAIFALLDFALGAAGAVTLPEGLAVATVDLRVDHLRASRAGRDLLGVGKVLRATQRIFFAEALAHDGDPYDPVAKAQGSFVIYEGHPEWHPRPKPPRR